MTRSAFNYDRDEASLEAGHACSGPSLTNQSESAETDINNIVAMYGLTGRLPESIRLPTYEDWTDAVDDYQTACNALREADAAFLTLPANVRARFHNDPQAFLEFVENEQNLPELRSMGLANPAPEPETPPVPPVTGEPA